MEYQFTNKERTKQYLAEIRKAMKGEKYFPANQTGDVVLMLSSVQIYEPYVDYEALKHVARRYIKEGLEFMVGNAYKVTGESNINYYAPHKEKDLKIRYLREIQYPLLLTTRTSSALRNSMQSKITITSQEEWDKKMHIDAYEWKYLAVFGTTRDLSYVWLPHPECAEEFKEIVRTVVQRERAEVIERKLDEYYQKRRMEQ